MKSDYTQDVTFNSDFGALQTPVHLATAMALSGWEPSKLKGHFRYLDLACGNGHTLTLLADAHPNAEFVGIDINPLHIEQAQGVANDAGLTNVTFICADLVTLNASEFHPFDYCAISGIYSWLDEARQAHIFNIIDDLLTDNGVFYLDYCALPGITQTATLYSMVQQLADQYTGSSAQRLTAATQLLMPLHKEKTPFFQYNQQAAERFARMLSNPAEDEAHEVLNLKPNAVWSKEIIEKAQEVGFTFVGSAGLHHNVPEFSAHLRLPETAKSLPISSQQMLQDVAWNVTQRKDIYCKSSVRSSRSLSDRLHDVDFYFPPGSLNQEMISAITRQFPSAKLLNKPNIENLLQCGVTGTVGELSRTFCQLYEQKYHRHCDFFDPLLEQLLATRVMSLAVVQMPVKGNCASFSLPSALNRLLLKQDLHMEFGRPLSSPVTGTRIVLPIKDRLYLWALTGNDLYSAWENLGELQGIFVGPDGKKLNADQFVHIIQSSLPAFKSVIAPELVRLGILQCD